jgi:hypothetical protein
VVNGVDYSIYSFESIESCLTACGGGACQDLAGIDFGACDMVMGPALLEGSCVELSGCGWVVNGVDYSVYSFASWADCQAACGGSECIDPSLSDPLIDCNPFSIEPVCGCDSLTHVNPCVATYMDWVSSYEVGPCAGDCYDENRIVENIACGDEEALVCGCDGTTYLNPCQAWYSGGLATWTEGPCAGNGIASAQALVWQAKRLESGQIRLQNWPLGATWSVHNATGQLVATGTAPVIPAEQVRGLIIVTGPGGAQRIWMP